MRYVFGLMIWVSSAWGQTGLADRQELSTSFLTEEEVCIDDNGNFLTDDNGNQLIKNRQGECVLPSFVELPAPTFVPVEDYKIDWVTCTNALTDEIRGNCIEINLKHISYIEFERPLYRVTFSYANGALLKCKRSYMVRGRQCMDILFRE